ncbi:FtsX-like permease family protein [Ruania halotolerans]|uniref:FtsX-like permease family protein n=1 Tax=Ruania halotolerans TaxID=2897773 RepID=UPI001E32C0BE|nr:FtsX-like permease family protein [Ruania halotolerans]UFU05477.1 FtsX-like permease family protein [Ruania halotolerans]
MSSAVGQGPRTTEPGSPQGRNPFFPDGIRNTFETSRRRRRRTSPRMRSTTVKNGERLYLRYGYNDLIKNKGVNAALLVILILSAFLMATGSMVIERLAGSISQLSEQGKPPDFLQMHKGDYDRAALERFAAEHESEIDAWQIEEMLGFDSATLAWERPSTGESGDLAASRIDNLFVTQNEEFDFLVDETGGIVEPVAGEVYVPVLYQQQYGLTAGDVLTIRTDSGPHELEVQGSVKDAQMAASLSPSSRFLIHPEDFEALERAGGATPEIIVEYLLAAGGDANAMQTAYEGNGELPTNGQPVTGQQLRIISVISDGLVALALVFVSLILIAIALLNLRFVISGTLEDEVREIGAMKAIGIPDRAISGLYLTKYSVLTLFACVVGGLLAVVAASALTQGIQTNYAQAPVGAWTFLVPLIALATVFVIVVGICRGVLGRVRKIEVVSALVHGSTLGEKQTARRARRQTRWVRRTGLASAAGGNVNRRLALLDLRAEGRAWVLLPVVYGLIAVLITFPANLVSTFESPRFVTYLGVAERDLRADVQFQEDVDGVTDRLVAAMAEDVRLTDVRTYAHVDYSIDGEDGRARLRVEIGDRSDDDELRFSEGRPPGDGEIALSVLNADKYQVGVGDDLTIHHDDGSALTVQVSGIYQDLTSGGLSAKMSGEVATGASAYSVYADMADDEADVAAVADEYDEQFPTAGVKPTQEYAKETLGVLIDSLRGAAWIALIFGIGVAVLITSLFLKVRLARDRSTMGVLSAIGFSAKELVEQVRTKALLVVAIGTVAGLVFVATAGQAIASGGLAALGIGITDLSFIPNPWLVYGLYPLLLLGAGSLGVAPLTAGIRRADKSQWLRE